jgi:type VI secretion system FHA domain protein
MRELIVGVIDSLHLRALQKAQLKQSNTIIQPRENNRLKFSANFEEGFSRLFLDDSDQYTSPVESVRGAFSDIKEHQRALLNSTRAALEEYLDRLEPQHLEQRACNGRSGSLITAANKLKYWDLYKEVYSILANGPAGELPQPFLDAFASAYEQASNPPAKKSAGSASRETG